jgi:hypothetical protein
MFGFVRLPFSNLWPPNAQPNQSRSTPAGAILARRRRRSFRFYPLWISLQLACQTPSDVTSSGETAAKSSSSSAESSISPTDVAIDPQVLEKGKPVPATWLAPAPDSDGAAKWTGCPHARPSCFVAWGNIEDPNFVALLRDIEALTHYYGEKGPSALAILLDPGAPTEQTTKRARLSFPLQWLATKSRRENLRVESGQIALVDDRGEVLEASVFPRDFIAFDRLVQVQR